MKKRNWKKYTFEFLSIFIAVISAFALNNWNEIRRDNQAESKILLEILNGLKKDIADIDMNVFGHEQGIEACNFWRKTLKDSTTNVDTVKVHYFNLLRDFVSIQNTSGYQALKSRGLELIKNDSLRGKIISIYEYDYQVLTKLEEEYSELQFQENYFHQFNHVVAPQLLYNDKGDITSLALPLNINEAQQKILLSYLWKIELNRKFILGAYGDVKEKINALIDDIEQEIS